MCSPTSWSQSRCFLPEPKRLKGRKLKTKRKLPQHFSSSSSSLNFDLYSDPDPYRFHHFRPPALVFSRLCFRFPLSLPHRSLHDWNTSAPCSRRLGTASKNPEYV